MASSDKDGCCKVCGDQIAPNGSMFDFPFCSIHCYDRAMEIARQREQVQKASEEEEKLAAKIGRSSARVRRARKKLGSLCAQWTEAIYSGDWVRANRIRPDGLITRAVVLKFEQVLKGLLRKAAVLREESLRHERRLDQLRKSN